MLDRLAIDLLHKPLQALARQLVRAGVGESGANPEYVLETARHLQSLGIRDRSLTDLVAALGGVDLPVMKTA